MSKFSETIKRRFEKIFRGAIKGYHSYQENRKIDYEKRYQRILKRITKQKKKIKVVFLVAENQKWGYQSLYDKFANSEYFEPLVLVNLLTGVHIGIDNTRNNLEENYNFFKSRGMNVEYSYINGEYISLKRFSPDIVFYEQPWALPDIYLPREVSKFALTCYSDYALELFDIEWHYDNKFHKNLFTFFVDSHLNIERYQTYVKDKIENCVAVGYSKLDVYLNDVNIDTDKLWRNSDKTKIIYAPHHAFESNGLNLATFKENGQFILNWAKEHPETTWLFKPHPRFKLALLVNEIMTENEVDDYFNEWATIGKVYTQGDYFSIFRSSDLMVTDCGSFLGEYLPTLKPIIRLINTNSQKLNKLGEIINDCCYCVNTNNDLENILNKLVIDKIDENLQKRKNAVNLIIDNNQTSSNRMYNYILNKCNKKWGSYD